MNRIFAFVLAGCLALAVTGVYAGSFTRAVTNRMTVLAPAAMRGPTPWSNSTAYAQGAIVLSTNGGTIYFALTPGTSEAVAAAPVGFGEVADSNVVWFSALKDTRKAWVIQNISGGPVTIQLDGSTTNNDGIVLTSGQTFAQDGVMALQGSSGVTYDPASVWQSAVYLVSTGATVAVTEW